LIYYQTLLRYPSTPPTSSTTLFASLTRIDVLKQIRAWADGDDERCIFWLNGTASTGKSTIPRIIAGEYHDRVGASFFSRDGGDAGSAGKFCITIALQLAENSPIFKHYLLPS
jgi:hypothetical protein